MPRFIIALNYSIEHEDNNSFKEFILLHANFSKYLKNLKTSSAPEGGFSLPNKCDIRYSRTTINNKSSINSLCSKECSLAQQEWDSNELNEFNSIVQSYFTVLTVILD